jgi:site-specific recombinase XerD
MPELAIVPSQKPSDQQLTRDTVLLPALVTAAGPRVSKRYFEFFAVTIRNEHTRDTYFRACRIFFDWCEQRGLTLESIEPIHVAAYIESRAKSDDVNWRLAKTSIKQHASALRMMFSYFVEKGVLSSNPAREVSTEKVRRAVGKTPAFQTDDVARLLGSFDTSSVVGLRDRALVAVMAFGFSRISAIVNLRVRDYIQQGRRACIRTHGKGGVEVDIPVITSRPSTWMLTSKPLVLRMTKTAISSAAR